MRVLGTSGERRREVRILMAVVLLAGVVCGLVGCSGIGT